MHEWDQSAGIYRIWQQFIVVLAYFGPELATQVLILMLFVTSFWLENERAKINICMKETFLYIPFYPTIIVQQI